MKQYKEYYGKEQAAATKCNGSYVATFAPAVLTDVAINERNENLRKLFATKRKPKSHSYNNLPHVIDTDVIVLPEKGQRNGHMANEVRSHQTVANYGNTIVPSQSLQKTGNRIRRWSVNRCGNVEMDKYVQQTTLANSSRSYKLNISNANNNNTYDDDNDEDIVSLVCKDFDKSEVLDDMNIDLFETRNQQYCSSYELPTLGSDNIQRLSKKKLLESEHCLPIIKPYVPRYDDDFEVSQENFVAPHDFVGNCFDAVETCSPNDFFAVKKSAYIDQWSMQQENLCANMRYRQQQQDPQELLNVNSMSELMKIRLERQAENSLKQKSRQHPQQPQQLCEHINLNTQLHNADIWHGTDEIKGNLYTTLNKNVR